jgi:hypothetical protein
MQYSINELHQHRVHLMSNIALADNKASSLMMIYKDDMPNSDIKEELNRAYLNVISPVLSTEGVADPFDISLSVDDLKKECAVLKEIVEQKYKYVSIILTIIRSNVLTRIRPASIKSEQGSTPNNRR